MSKFLSPDLNLLEPDEDRIQVRPAYREPHRVSDADVPDYYFNPLEALLAKEELLRRSNHSQLAESDPVETSNRSADWALDRPMSFDWKQYYDEGYEPYVMLSTNPDQFVFDDDIALKVERELSSKRSYRQEIWDTAYQRYQSHGFHGRKRRCHDKFSQPTCW
jgi:hypothetical protein